MLIISSRFLLACIIDICEYVFFRNKGKENRHLMICNLFLKNVIIKEIFCIFVKK